MVTGHLTAQEAAHIVKGHVEGDPKAEILEISKIDSPNENSLTFLANMAYLDHIHENLNRVILVPLDLNIQRPDFVTLIRVNNVYEAFAKLASRFERESLVPSSDRAHSKINEDARIAVNVIIGAFTVINGATNIGSGSVIGDHVYIGSNVRIGQNCRIHHGVKIYHDVTIGDNCIIYANVVIGSDGFGHARDGNSYAKVPQLGKVVIKDDVEIGANTVIDRATIGETIIRRGVKLDNLIQVAHGVDIGANTIIAAQTGISGSSKIGAHSLIGGQVGIAGHLQIAEGSQIQAKSGVASHIHTPRKKWYGYPIITYMGYLRSYSLFRKLPELFERLRRLEDKLK